MRREDGMGDLRFGKKRPVASVASGMEWTKDDLHLSPSRERGVTLTFYWLSTEIG